MSLLTKVCVGVGSWIVVRDEGFLRQLRGIELRPASSRFGEVAFGPSDESSCDRHIINRNRKEPEVTDEH